MSAPRLNKSKGAAKFSRTCAKHTRTTLINFLLRFRRPRRAAIVLILAVLGFLFIVVALVLVLHLSPWAWRWRVEYSSAHHALSLHLKEAEGESAFAEEACERKYDAVWRVKSDDGAEARMKENVSIAYFVQVGADAVNLLPRLFARIHHLNNVYIVHIDAKVERSSRDWIEGLILANETYRRNMYMLPSEMVTYKGISMVTNTLSAMTLALEKHSGWDYFINLSGADYPLISPEDQARLLARPKIPIGRLNFITFFPTKEWVPYSFRVRLMHWDPAAVGYQSPTNRLRVLRTLKENPLEQHRAYTFTKAEAWVILSRPFVEFVIRSSFAKTMLVNHVHVRSAPEHYFGDILYNHPFWRTTVVPDAFRKVVWYLKNRRSGQHPYLLDQGPTDFAMWEYIAETKSLFARKFSKPDSRMMDKIDAQMSGSELNKSDQKYTSFAAERKVFYDRIVRHFDQLTKKTLELQDYSYPRDAYPRT